jgi:hypothetical protein
MRLCPRIALSCGATALVVLHLAPANACTPWAERVAAWSAASDLYVLAGWDNREKPPPSQKLIQPQYYQLKRISTGEQLAWHRCDHPTSETSGPRPCTWQAAFAKQLAGASFQPGNGIVNQKRLRVRAIQNKGVREYSLESRGPKGWQRVLYLDFIFPDYPERRRYSVTELGSSGEHAILMLDYQASGGNCSHTAARAFRLHKLDLTDPTSAERRARLLASVSQEDALEDWRTLAELAPLPADRLLEALEAAESKGQIAWGARWWREASADLAPEQLARLRDEIQRRPGLQSTRSLLAGTARARRDDDSATKTPGSK